ncbi:Odorant receptor 1 [Ladona fulva]|uniref:Odorant receptor n=1 Tax=Ladona fulva TaxID=123851 RepID=A0A8K0JTT0_LADFU|nr:Odorant receptor 1 [Ladona fulva]
MARRRIEYLRFHRDLLRFMWLFPSTQKKSWKTTVAIVSHFSMMAALLFQLAGELMDFVIHSHEIDIWTDVACMAVFSCSSIVRLVILFYKKDDLYNLMSKWEDQFVRKSPFNPARKDVERLIFKTKAYILTTTIITMLIAFHWCVYPIAVAILFPEQSRKLPLRAWYPFDMYASPIYEFIYLMQIIRGVFGTYIAVYWETTLMSFCILTYYEAKKLKEHLRSIATDFKEGEEDKIEDYLTKCILHHRTTVRFVKRIGETYSHALVVELFYLVVPMCFTALKVSSFFGNDTTKYLNWLEFFLAGLIQLFILCLGGHIVTSQIVGMSFSNFIVLRQLKESKYSTGLQS